MKHFLWKRILWSQFNTKKKTLHCDIWFYLMIAWKRLKRVKSTYGPIFKGPLEIEEQASKEK